MCDDRPLPPWPPDPPGGPWGPRAAMSDDGSHERLYNPDNFGCGAPLAIAAALSATAVVLALVAGIPLVGWWLA